MEAIYQFSHDKLWHKIIDLEIEKDLQKRANQSPSVIAKMAGSESVNSKTFCENMFVFTLGFRI